eukprot:5013590-Pleurochrysis_carterae.AAC.3
MHGNTWSLPFSVRSIGAVERTSWRLFSSRTACASVRLKCARACANACLPVPVPVLVRVWVRSRVRVRARARASVRSSAFECACEMSVSFVNVSSSFSTPCKLPGSHTRSRSRAASHARLFFSAHRQRETGGMSSSRRYVLTKPRAPSSMHPRNLDF